MFFLQRHKDFICELENKLDSACEQIRLLKLRIEVLESKPEPKPITMIRAPYGYRKDGTPKSKPGRKVGLV